MSERQATYTTDAPVPDLRQIEAMAVLVAQARIAGHTMDQAHRRPDYLGCWCTNDRCTTMIAVLGGGTIESSGISEPCLRSTES